MASPEFTQYAAKNLVLVKVDAAVAGQSEALAKANEAWKTKFAVKSQPTLVVVGAELNALGRLDGYGAGAGGQFMQRISRLSGKKVEAVAGGGESGAVWLTSVPQALAKAKAEKKLVLLDFTGSDWCSWCMKLKSEVFNQPEFKEYAKKNLVLVEVDFPKRKPQPADVRLANERLAEQYKIEGYPTVIILNSDGRKVGETGYEEGGPARYTALLEAMKQ